MMRLEPMTRFRHAGQPMSMVLFQRFAVSGMDPSFIGARSWIRTRDPRRVKAMLYH
jgi:hypothetical protein